MSSMYSQVNVLDELKHITVAREICKKHYFKTLDKVIYRYKSTGIYVPDGETFIEHEAQELLGSKASTNTINETVKWIARASQTQSNEFDADTNIINTQAGLFNIATLELKEHTPEYPSLIQIPVFYHSSADCPAIRKFLSEILRPEDIPVIEELLGYCLLRQYPIQKAFLFVGEGSNGKSTLIELMRTFLGRNNCSSPTFQELEEDKFARSGLFMKLANLSADIPSKGVSHADLFRRLTGGDEINADRKFLGRIQFMNHAKLIYSANRPPKVYNEDSYAFWRRWIIIEFPNQFTKNADNHLLSKLTNPNEMEGLLNLALKGLQRLQKNGDFSYHKSIDEVAERYNTLSDPVLGFANDCCVLEQDATVPKDILYDAFIKYCEEKRIPKTSKESFGRNLRNSPTLKVGLTRTRDSDNRTYAYRGIRLKNDNET